MQGSEQPKDTRERGYTVRHTRLARLRKQAGLIQQDLADAAVVKVRTLRRMETEPGEKFDIAPLRRLADVLKIDFAMLVGRTEFTLSLPPDVESAYRLWSVLDSRGQLNFAPGIDVKEAIRNSEEDAFYRLSGGEVDQLVFLLMVRDYLDRDAEGRYFVVNHRPREVMEERVYLRTEVELAAVRWLFADERRSREVPLLMEEMRAKLERLNEPLRVMRRPEASDKEVLDALYSFYDLEPAVHLAKVEEHPEFCRTLERLLASCVRVRIDLLNAELEYAELKKRSPQLKDYIDDAVQMYQEHVRFLNLAEEEATVDTLCGHDDAHAGNVNDCLKRLESLRFKIAQERKRSRGRRSS